MDNTWAFNLGTVIFSKVKAESLLKLKTKYPSIVFTTSDRNKGNPVYPTVYIHELPGAERSDDLRGITINAVNETIQVEVITDSSQSDARYIMSIVGSIFKSMGFQINNMPNFDNGATYYRLVMRCQKLIGSGEHF